MKLRAASVEALVAISETIAPDMEDRRLVDHWRTLWEARHSLKVALGLAEMSTDDLRPIELIDALARVLQRDEKTRDLGDRIQRITQPALTAPTSQAAE